MRPIGGPIGLLVVLFGYLAAVFVAVAVTVTLYMAGMTLTSGGEPMPAFAASLVLGLWVGCLITCPTALPGFVIAVVLAKLLDRQGLAWFATAGALDAVLALGIFVSYDSAAYFPAPTVLACIIGGLAGGIAYWKAAGQFLADWLRPEVA